MKLGQEEILEDLKGVDNLCTCMKLSKKAFKKMLKIKIVVEITAAMGSIKHDNNKHG